MFDYLYEKLKNAVNAATFCDYSKAARYLDEAAQLLECWAKQLRNRAQRLSQIQFGSPISLVDELGISEVLNPFWQLDELKKK